MSWKGPLARTAGALAGGLLSWQGFAELKRTVHERSIKKRVIADRDGRKIRETFFAGSTDDTISETLQTGDVVFFNRPCLSMRPCGSALCASTKSISNSAFDHVGMIYVRKDFKPMLIENTFSGIKIRPWDERLSRSQAGEIIVHPLRYRRTPELMERMTRVVEAAAAAAKEDGGDGVVGSLASLALLAQRWSVNKRTDTTTSAHRERNRKKQGGNSGSSSDSDGAVPAGNEDVLVGTDLHSSVANGSAALVCCLLSEMGALAKEGERGYVPTTTVCPEDLLHMQLKKGAKLRDPIYVRTVI